jgi:hypothetical protein
MSTAAEPKKFSVDYPIIDDNGNQVGPPQHFEADTQKELLELVTNAHINAAKEMYKEKKARKIGDLITPDPEKPIQRYERKPLSADERTRLANAIKDPQTSPEAVRQLIEAELGADTEAIRDGLQYVEIFRRQQLAAQEIEKFRYAHPEYILCDSNQELISKWLLKRNYAITHRNLELAYEDLGDLITKQKPEPPAPAPVTAAPEPTPQVSAPVATPAEEIPAPPLAEAIPQPATPAPAITEPPAEVRPRVSSTGLSRDNASAPSTVAAPKAAGITPQQIARMSSREFEERLKDPAFRKMVDEMRV